MDWLLQKRSIGQAIGTVRHRHEPRTLAADPAFANFNYTLPPQDSPGTTGTYALNTWIVDEDAADILEARNALSEPGKRVDYDTFRRELGLD